MVKWYIIAVNLLILHPKFHIRDKLSTAPGRREILSTPIVSARDSIFNTLSIIMIELKDIYAATNGGKQIILDLVPNATEGKNFSYRSDDKHPSARLYPLREGRGYWVIKDFGTKDEEAIFSPIDIFMRERGIPQTDFHVAVLMLAEQYGVTDQLDRSVNCPRIENRPATIDEHNGDHPFKVKDSISDAEAKIWGRNVMPEHLAELGWSSVEWIASVKDGQVSVLYSTDTYPIFIQHNPFIDTQGNERCFYKVYQPFSYDKSWRFYSIGQKPQDYIFGLEALKRKFNLNDQQPFDQICLVSGGSDAANCLAMGMAPVYLGSETQTLTPEMYKQLKKYAKTIYVCYDADEAGIAAARQLALQYQDIKVVWLPTKEFDKLHDKRGKTLKDLKDYLQIHPSQYDFKNLFRQARQAKFWDMWKEKSEDRDQWKVDLSLTRLCYFFWLNGYMLLRDPLFHDARFIHIDGIVVEEVSLSDIHHFLKDWMIGQGLPDMVIDRVMRSRDLQASMLSSNMTEVELNFSSATPTSQWFYLQNCCVEVTKDSLTRHEYSRMPKGAHYVWKHQIIQHNYVQHEPMFTIERQENGMYSITIHSTDSEAFCFLINASRIHWRKEMEYRFEDDPKSKSEYARTHKFCINGEGLTEEEIAAQMQSLVNKIFCYGYLLHRYKMMSRAWGVICYDGHIGENDECNGRTGKSLFGKIVRAYMPTVTIEAKSRNITERQFLYAKVSYDTELLFVDECHKDLDYDHFFGRITDDFQVEKKGCDPESIPFSDSPKLLIDTNYINRKRDASTEARELPSVFSDYYHQRAKNNDYLEDRSVADDFGHNLIDDRYEGWEHDIAFLIQCEQFYLAAAEGDRKIFPPLDSIHKRQQKAAMGKTFEQWAEDYFQHGSGHLDIELKLNDVYQSYRAEAQSHSADLEPFVKKLQEYCDYADHIAVFNPKDVTGCDKDGKRWRKHETSGQVRYIYVRSIEETERMVVESKPEPVQAELNFDPFAAANDLDDRDDEEEVPF